MFFPITINLGFYTLTPLNGLLSVPLQTAFALLLASNLTLLFSFVAAGYGSYLLLRHVGESQARVGQMAALFGGIVYAFTSSKLFYASLGQFNIASSQWIPFTLLYVLRAGERRRLRDGLLAGLFLSFQAWSELTYASFLLIFITLYFGWQLLGGNGTKESLVARLAACCRLLWQWGFFLARRWDRFCGPCCRTCAARAISLAVAVALPMSSAPIYWAICCPPACTRWWGIGSPHCPSPTTRDSTFSSATQPWRWPRRGADG